MVLVSLSWNRFWYVRRCTFQYLWTRRLDEVFHVLLSLDKKSNWLAVYLDLCKAFDIIDHDFILRKLIHYGIRDEYQEWFQSYLWQRKQYVSYKGHNSDIKYVLNGIPQDSILFVHSLLRW